MKIAIDKTWELQNIVLTKDGPRTRRGFFQMKTPTAGTTFVGGFTVESPSTTEPWHYIFEQSTTTLEVTLRVYTEEFLEMFSFPLGVLQQDPVITWGVINNQLMVSSPAFPATLFGMPGGGLIAATKTLSVDPTSVTLDVPVGHIASFGGNFVVAVGPIVYGNQPRADLDPRTFVSDGVIQSFPGTVYDVFQGVDGALYVFTSAGAFTVAADALGQGQNPAAFISKIPGINVSRPRNAVASDRGVLVLDRDAVIVLGGPRIPIPQWEGFRSTAQVTAVDDLRTIGELHATPTGFLIGFRSSRGFYIVGDLETGSVSFFFASTSGNSALSLVGTLRSRDGECIVITSGAILVDCMGGERDHDGVQFTGVACGRLPVDPDDRPLVRRMTVPSDAVGAAVNAAASGSSDGDIVPTLTGDVIVGTTLWSDSGTVAARAARTTRLTLNKRVTEPSLEVSVTGAERRIGDIDVDVGGLQRGKADKRS